MSSASIVHEESGNLWEGGISPMKVSYGKLMMWFFLLSDAFTFSGLLIAYGYSRFKHVASLDWGVLEWPVPEKVFAAFPFMDLFGITHAPLVFVGIMTFVLILSSVTMVLAVEAGQRMDKAAVEKWMLWTIVGGITFLGCQAWEWMHFIHGHEALVVVDGLGAARWDVLGKSVEVISTGKIIDITNMSYKVIEGATLSANEYGPKLFADFFFFITGFHGTHVFSGVILNIIIFYNVSNNLYQKRGHYEMIEKVGLYWHFVDLVWVFVFTFFYLL
jgi:cytochrome c oxidase subunit 3